MARPRGTRHRRETVRHFSTIPWRYRVDWRRDFPSSASSSSQCGNRGGALLLDPPGPRPARARDRPVLSRRLQRPVAIHVALKEAGHRSHAAIRRKASQRTGENRFVGKVHNAVAVYVAALAGVADPVRGEPTPTPPLSLSVGVWGVRAVIDRIRIPSPSVSITGIGPDHVPVLTLLKATYPVSLALSTPSHSVMQGFFVVSTATCVLVSSATR